MSVLLLALMGIIGLASLDTAMRDRQLAGYQRQSNTALYAADGGVASSLGIVRQGAQGLAVGGEAALLAWNPPFPDQGSPQLLGEVLPNGQPEFYMDPDATDPDVPANPPQAVRYIGQGGPCQGWVMSEEIGSTAWREALWDLRVRGRAPGGATYSIQATATNCHPYN